MTTKRRSMLNLLLGLATAFLLALAVQPLTAATCCVECLSCEVEICCSDAGCSGGNGSCSSSEVSGGQCSAYCGETFLIARYCWEYC